jgi:hypothetical protein
MTGKEVAEAVQARAAHRCEYCRMHQALQGATFHVEHVVPKSQGGLTELTNLAFSCVSCNLHKSDRIEAPDPITGTQASLFNPRQDQWADHFPWNGFQIEGKSAIGRATVDALQLNSERRLWIREAEAAFELFPP